MALLPTSSHSASGGLRPFQVERRNRLVDAGLRLLYENDPDLIQVKDVATEAGVATGTAYRYFNSKDQLLGAVYLAWMEQLNKRITSRPFQGKTDAERIRELLFRSIRAIARWPQFYKTLTILERSTDPAIQGLLDELGELSAKIYGAALEETTASRRPAIIRNLTAVMNNALRSWVIGRLPLSRVYLNIEESIALIFPSSGG